MANEDVLALARVRALCRSGAARSVRLAAGLSLREIAEPLGVSATTIMRWEDNRCHPTGAPAVRYEELLRQLMRPDRDRVEA